MINENKLLLCNNKIKILTTASNNYHKELSKIFVKISEFTHEE